MSVITKPPPPAIPLRRLGRGLRRVGGGAVNLVTAAAVAGLLTIVALPLLHAQTLVVTSGSMTPYFVAGDAVVIHQVDPTNVQVGNVITFHGLQSHHLTTHRVIDLRQVDGKLFFRTKGDANASPDPNLAPATGLRGRVVAVLPKVGRLLVLLSTPMGKILGLSIPAAAIAAGELRDVRRRRRARTARRARSPHGSRSVGMVALLALAGAPAVLGPGHASRTEATYVDTAPVTGNDFATADVRPPAITATTFACGLAGIGSRITVDWDTSAAGAADAYEVLRATTVGGPYQVLATVTAPTTTYDDTSVALDTTYHYVVRTLAGTWQSANSAEATITTPTVCVV